MDNFARKPADERLAFIQEAANRRNLLPIIIEKDFWVCWTLRRLSEHSDLGPNLTFKGGTSLSKAYAVIERFSEDIDLTIGRAAPFIRDTLSPMEDGISTKERGRRIDALKVNARRYVADIAQPALASVVRAALGTSEGWQVVLDDDDPDAQTLLLHYPRLLNYGMGYGGGSYGSGVYGEGEFGYIKPQIKLEFGARGEIEPSETRSFMPYVAEAFRGALPNAVSSFSTLMAERTFWEKATILHDLHHGVKARERMSRHYYDTYMLAQKGVAASALKNPDLLASVVKNKSLMFSDPKASYGTAIIGTLKLTPMDDTYGIIRRDYAAMSEMFMGEAPNFEAMMRGLAELEHRINNPAG